MRTSRQAFAALLVVLAGLLAVQGAVTILLIQRERAQVMEESGRTVARVLTGAAANVNRGLLQTDALLSGLDALAVVPPPDELGAAPEASRSLRALADQSFLLRDLMVLTGDGHVLAAGLAATRRHPPPVEAILPPMAAQGTLAVGNPRRNPLTGEWSLYLGRVLRLHGDGPPLLVVAELPLPNLSRLMLPDQTIAGLRVSLERSDGHLLVSVPHDPRRIGQPLPAILDRLAATGQWALVPDRHTPGARAIAAAAPSLYEGLVVVAQMEEGAALARWREARTGILAASAGIAAVLVAAVLAGTLHIRQRERAAAAVQQSKRLLDQALDSMSEGFAVFDSANRLVAANRRYAELFPYLADLLDPGTPFERIAERAAANILPGGSGEERRAWIDWRLNAHLSGGSFEQTLPSGTVVQSSQAEMPGGGLVGVHRDVTAVKQTEARLAEAKEAAERANRLKSEFLSNMSHELRTPLNAIIGFAQVLEQEAGEPGGWASEQEARMRATRIEYARDIRSSGEHLLAIINDVLDMAKLDAGAMKLHETVSDLVRLVMGAAGILREQARQGGVTLRIEPCAGMLPMRLDERLIRQVVLNLVSNALKFTERGGTVSVGVAADGADEIRITVADTGIGIPAEHLPKIFQPFFQVDGTTARRQGGTGLGLPISLAIMQMHQGRLEIRSEPGMGTVAVATLPADRCVAAAPDGSGKAERVPLAGGVAPPVR